MSVAVLKPSISGQVRSFLAKPKRLLIDGEWVEAASGKTFTVEDPATQETIAHVAEGDAADIDRAVEAARRAFETGPWAAMLPAERARLVWRLGDLLEAHADELAELEALDNGKPITAARRDDVGGSINMFRYMSGWATRLTGETIPVSSPGNWLAYTTREPVGVVGQIIPWNFPLLMAAWKLAPALAAGNAVVLKPAEQTPATIMMLMDLVGDLIPPGVLNVVNGFGIEAGKPLAQNRRVAKVAFTGETTTGRLIMQYASENLIPVTLELGGKSPNVFFGDVLDQDDDFAEKALEGFCMFLLNQGEVCTCPSRVLLEKKIEGQFLERAVERAKRFVPGNPLDPATTVGAQASNDQLEKILSYIDIGKQEGAEVLLGGARAELPGELAGGYYVQPTVFRGRNTMRVFQEEIFGPVVSVTSFDGFDEAIALANDTLYGLGAGVWTRNVHTAFRAGRAIQAGRVWTNCYHLYPAHAAFGGYKQSGIGRETHRMMLDHYQQTKNLLVSYDTKPMGFF